MESETVDVPQFTMIKETVSLLNSSDVVWRRDEWVRRGYTSYIRSIGWKWMFRRSREERDGVGLRHGSNRARGGVSVWRDRRRERSMSPWRWSKGGRRGS